MLIGNRLGLALALVVSCSAAALAAPPAPAPAAETVVLDDNAVWHCWLGWRTVQIANSDGRLVTLWDGKAKKNRPLSASEPPPANWFAADFDDSVWARSAGPFGINAWSQSYVDIFGPGNPGEVAMICIRGKFRVDDPAAVPGLKLLVDYHGGLIAYLNGKELLRSNLPAGDVTFDTLATTYPDEVYIRPDGKRLTERDSKEFPEPYANRVRHVELAIPADRLVKGANVLAVAVCRAPTAEVYMTAPTIGPAWPGPTTPWPHARIVNVKLSAAPEAAGKTQSATKRQPGIRVWNRSVLEPTDPTDFDDPLDKLAPVRIAGCRNGSFSGMVVVSSDAPIANLSAKAGELKQAGGSTIPASAVRVRFGLPDGTPYQWYNAPPLTCDSLLDGPPNPVAITDKRGGAICPVWLTVSVPRDAAPGEYAGKLTVSADGLPANAVDVRLAVSPFVLPAATKLTPHVGLIQSPDSVALQYKVEMWSPRHWELLDKTFELLGQVGNKTVYIPLLRETHFGNENSMVRWIRNADGSWSHDFSIVEKYLDLAAKHLGRPQFVILYLWERYTGQTYLGTGKDAVAAKGLLITVVDPKTGALSPAEGPKWDDPKIVEFLKPVVDGIRDRLAKRGMDGSMIFGLSGDMRPTKITAEVLKQVAPGVRWVNQAHPTLVDLYGIPAGYVTNVWNSGAPNDPLIKRNYYQPGKFVLATFPREGSKCVGPMRQYSSPVVPRLINEATVAAGMDGVGRVGADFWNVLSSKSAATGPGSIIARYPDSSWSQLGINHATSYMLGPGPDGPVSTIRFELLREGVQTTEARIQIERALGDPAARGKLGEELAARCDRLLDARVHAILRSGASGMAGGAQRNPYWWSFVSSPWQGRDTELFDLAAKVAEIVEK
jgi:hypothetical protein